MDPPNMTRIQAQCRPARSLPSKTKKVDITRCHYAAKSGKSSIAQQGRQCSLSLDVSATTVRQLSRRVSIDDIDFNCGYRVQDKTNGDRDNRRDDRSLARLCAGTYCIHS